MEIVHIAAELTPIAKVGGLGDVLLGLCRALSQKGHQVEIILPKYDCLDLTLVKNLEVKIHDLSSFFDGEWHHNTIWQGEVKGIRCTLIEAHDPLGFFERKTIYGCPDDPARFCYFARAAAEYLFKEAREPDIIHLHDWHVSIFPVLLKEVYEPLGFSLPKMVLTIHNLAYQGLCIKEHLDAIGIPGEKYDQPELIQDLWKPDQINLIKAGILFCDAITTVSPEYAKEILTPEKGHGLDRVLSLQREKFLGILNGIDYEYWNPETDPHLPFHFSAAKIIHRDFHPFILEKGELKAHLRKTLLLADEECPIVSCIARLVPQKGPELMKFALLRTLERGGQFVLLGSAHDKETHTHFYNLKRKLAGSRHVHIELSYNESMSHLVYAASDLFLIPSRFEPCGLTQMIAMRYGTVPLVRKTGGLADTVFENKNGFLFSDFTAEGILSALDRSIDCWFDDPVKWRSLMSAGMNRDFSWNYPTEEYLKIYRKILKRK